MLLQYLIINNFTISSLTLSFKKLKEESTQHVWRIEKFHTDEELNFRSVLSAGVKTNYTKSAKTVEANKPVT